MEIILYTRCYRSDPDPVRKVPDPDPYPAGQKSPVQDPHHWLLVSKNRCKVINSLLSETDLIGIIRITF